jgi:hypothetical protein
MSRAAKIGTADRARLGGVRLFAYLRYDGENEIVGGGPRCRPQAPREAICRQHHRRPRCRWHNRCRKESI